MKITRVSGRNITTFDRFDIDLEGDQLKEVGLFAIVGATGSGKSTLLDAICLALYGRTPRYSNHGGIKIGLPQEDEKSKVLANDPRALMSHGTGYTEATVEFIRGGARFRAKWSAQRARKKPDGILQNAKQELWELMDAAGEASEDQEEDGAYFLRSLTASKLSTTRRLIEEKIGLRYEEFCRTVFLAQGEFDVFLKKDDDRSRLLELITGDLLYSKIAEIAGEYLKQAEDRLQLLKAEEEGGHLDEGELTKVQSDLKVSKAAIREERSQLEKVHEYENALRQLQQYLAQLDHLSQEHIALTQIMIEERGELLTDEVLQLFTYEQLLETSILIERLSEEQQDLLSSNMALAHADEVSQEEDLKFDKQQHDISKKIETNRERTQGYQLILERHKNLNERVRVCDEQHDQIQEEQEDLTRQRVELFQRLAESEELKKSISGIVEANEAWLIAHQDYREIIDQKENWFPLFKFLRALYQQRVQQRNALAEDGRTLGQLQQRIQEHLLNIQEKRSQHLQLKQEKETLQQRLMISEESSISLEVLDEQLALLRELQTTLQHLHETHEMSLQFRSRVDEQELALKKLAEQTIETSIEQRVCEARLQEVERALRAQHAQAALIEFREALEEGFPCPLCGSVEHPGLTPTSNESDRLAEFRLQELRAQLATHHEMAHALKAQQLDIQQSLNWCMDQYQKSSLQLQQQVERWQKCTQAKLWQSLIKTEGRLSDFDQVTFKDLDQEEGQALFEHLLKITEDATTRTLRSKEEQVRETTIRQLEIQRLVVLEQQLLSEEQKLNHLSQVHSSLETQIVELNAEQSEKNEHLFEIDREISEHLDRLAQLSPLKLTSFSDEDLNLLNEHWQALCVTWAEHEQSRGTHHKRLNQLDAEKTSTLQHIQEIELKIKRAADRSLDLNKTRADITQQIKELRPAIEENSGLENELNRLHFELQHTLSARVELTRGREERALKRGETSAKLNDLKSRLEKASQLREQLINEHQITQERLIDYIALWRTLDLQALRSKRLELISHEEKGRDLLLFRDKTMKQRDLLIDHLEQHHDLSESLIIMINTDHPDTLNTVERLIQDQRRQRADLNESLNQWVIAENKSKELIAAHEHAVRLREHESEEVKFAYAEVKKWRLIHSSLGGLGKHSGFNAFAQQFTLELIIQHANFYLDRLMKRYQLMMVRDEKKPLSFQIIDRDLGDEPRSVNSLSGGESFLISLALALGLSSTTSHDTNIESLFIDEGFGTLDPEALDLAISMLDNLQLSGVQIGIISHVEGIAERIGTQLQVSKTGAGKSRINIAHATENILL